MWGRSIHLIQPSCCPSALDNYFWVFRGKNQIPTNCKLYVAVSSRVLRSTLSCQAFRAALQLQKKKKKAAEWWEWAWVYGWVHRERAKHPCLLTACFIIVPLNVRPCMESRSQERGKNTKKKIWTGKTKNQNNYQKTQFSVEYMFFLLYQMFG